MSRFAGVTLSLSKGEPAGETLTLSSPKGKGLSTIRVIREDVKIRGLFLRLVFVCLARPKEYESAGSRTYVYRCPILRVFLSKGGRSECLNS